MKTLLYICPVIPAAKSNGIAQTNHEILKRLCKDYRVTLLITRGIDKSDRDLIIKNYDVDLLEYRRSFFQFVVMFFKFFYFPLQSILYFGVKLPDTYFDVVYGSTVRVAPLVFRVHSGKRTINFADTLSRTFHQRSSISGWHIKWLYKYEAHRLAVLEKKTYYECDVCFSFERECEYSVHVTHGSQFDSVRHIRNANTRNVIFFGNMKYWPNRLAVEWFLQCASFCSDLDFTFCIVGRGSDTLISHNNKKNLKILGYVEDLEKLISSAYCCIAPISFGGGIQNKVIDSLHLGCPTIIPNYLLHTGLYDVAGVTVADTFEQVRQLLKSEFLPLVDIEDVKLKYNWTKCYEQIKAELEDEKH